MFGCGGEIELTALLPSSFAALVSQTDWTMRLLILDGPDWETSTLRVEVDIGWTQTLH